MEAVAIIGYGGRFPGARDAAELWENLRLGRESIRFFTDEELLRAGIDPALLRNPQYVRARGELDQVDRFDAGFFGFNPREAEVADPQQRIFLECCWEALEHAGYDPETFDGEIGLYAGAALSTYLLYLCSDPALIDLLGWFQVVIGNDKDALATRASYKLNLRGPSVGVQTACSTSLVAVHLACQALLAGECDMALAGGVAVRVPQNTGYLYQEGSILSPDGRCRAFDAQAGGTVGGNGCGVVVLKRLADAVADGDAIHAVIRGSAVNNDGSRKVGYTAPSVQGQASVILEAQRIAGVDPESVGYVEAHGTGTALGDPIEVSALTQAFRAAGSRRRGYCALGSVKTNVGHLDAAAGVTGLIKAVLAVERGEIPPSLHYREPNEKIDFAASPFFVSTELREWPPDGAPRRAGVSSFGIGGTNAHVVLEQAPDRPESDPGRGWELLALSGRGETVVERAASRLAAHLAGGERVPLADVSYTLSVGRRAFGVRRAVLCRDRQEALAGLAGKGPRSWDGVAGQGRVAFVFPGQGAQYAGMGRELAEKEPAFRAALAECAEGLAGALEADLDQTRWTQPALFAVEYALARLWESWGVEPVGMLGHSVGEYVAAVLGGLFDLDTALWLVSERGRLMQEAEPGAMAAVGLSAEEAEASGLEVAVDNGPAGCVVGGGEGEIADLVSRLEASGVWCRRLKTSHAFHTRSMETAAERFRDCVEQVRRSRPHRLWISNVTGRLIDPEEARTAEYWSRQLRGRVRFGEGLRELLAPSVDLVLEVGPGRGLSALVKRAVPGVEAVPGLVGEGEQEAVLSALGRLWVRGAEVDWQGYWSGQRRHRVPLPTYPFERQRYWIDLPSHRVATVPVLPDTPVDSGVALESEHSRPELASTYVAPRNSMEEALAGIWQQLLGLDRVGVHDDFFELGGDSILSIQVAARAARQGIRITSAEVFEHPSVAALAAVARRSAPTVSEDRPVEGPVRLTPSQLRFFETAADDPQTYSQAVMLESRGPVDAGRLREALARLVGHHDALRLRFERSGDRWRQHNAVAETSDLLIDAEDAEVAARELRSSLDLRGGPLVRAALLHSEGRPDRVLLVAHALVVDGVSWRILLEDLESAYEGRALPARTTSYQEWAERLGQAAEAGRWDAEGEAWLEASRGEESGEPGAVREATAGLDEEETRQLLQEAPEAYRTRIEDLLLTALAATLTGASGRDEVRVELEGHGRQPEHVGEGLDLSRTVGRFITAYPVKLRLRPGIGPGPAIQSVKEQLRSVPGQGLGYGALRYGPGEWGSLLREQPGCEVSFNYLGQLEAGFAEGERFRWTGEGAGGGSPRRGRHPLEVRVWVARGRLEVSWLAGPERLGLAERYLDNLRGLLRHCLEPGAGGYTPSDFPLAGLDQATLDRLAGGGRRIEDIYPLSPMQEGMLFQSLYRPGYSIYLEQLGAVLEGHLDVLAFRRAWNHVVRKHPVLRAAFLWEGIERPVQVVHRFVDLPWQQLDFSPLDPGEARRELDRVLAEDRRLGFSLKEAPLLRVTLAKMGPQTWSIDWSFHHILIDGWSIGLVLKDVLETYERLAQGRPLDPARPQLYTSYIAWLGRQDLAKAEAWWRAELAGFRSPTPLRLSPGPALSGSGGIDDYLDEVLQLPAASTAALQAWARSRQLTLNTLVQGAWALLLARHAGKDGVVFGSTVSGRPSELPDVETMVGLFINSLPFRVRVDGGRPTPEWLKEIQSRHAALREYQFSPLVQVQHWSELPRGVPLFNSILIFENYPVQPYLREQREGFRIDAVHTNPVKGFYDFILIAAPGERLKLTLTYDRRLASPEDARRRLRDLEEILTGLAADPPRLVGELLAASGEPAVAGFPGERESRGPSAGPAELVHRRILAQAGRTPDALAVLDGEGSISYGELGRRARRLARFLQRSGVGPEVRVGVCLDAGIEAVVALLGVLAAGGAYVPLAPDHPAERLRWTIEDAGAEVVLTLQDHADRLAGLDVRVVRLDAERERIEAETDEPREAVDPDNLAYVIYTSGSTGRPKGVLVSQGGLASFASAMIQHLGLTGADRFLHGIALSFDAAGEEIYPVLCAGGAVVVDRRLGDSPPGELLERCGRAGATVIHVVAPWWRQVASALEEGSAPLPASVRLVVSGGEILTARDAKPAGVPLVNAYGPTEATITATLYTARPDDAGRLPIGRPIQNAEVYVLDSGGERTAAGAAGEIHVGGAGVARGYLRRPDLTAERFVPHPCSAEPGARLYRTGDLGRWRADGELEFLGRADDQVKLRGYRIELGEIETALQELDGVREAAAQLRDGRLVAYVAGDAPAGELRRRLGERLPDYMVPAVFVRLPALPRNAFGKLDRLALPEPGPERPELEQDYAAPGSPVEQALATVWRQLLKLDRVGVHDNFFELGGDSILSIQVVSRAAREGIRLTPAEVFANPTIAALARVARREARAAANRERVEGPVRLTPIQRWFFAADPADPHHFNQAVVLDAWEPVDAERLRGALTRLVEHHDALRLRFEPAAGSAVIAPGESADLLVEVDGDMGRVRELQAGLDLRQGPLLRATLVRSGDGRPDRLALLVHHLAVDGVSWRILLEDLDAAYAGRELPGKTTSVQEWSERLWQAAEAGRWDGEGEAWLEASRGPDALPVDRDGGELRVGTAREVTAGLYPEETRQLLQEAPEAYRTQINDLLLTALAATLAEWTGRDEARIEMEGHGRQPEQVDDVLDLSRTVGWFTTVYPVKLRVEPGSGPGAAIKSVKEQLRRVPGQGLGYGVLRYGSGPWAETLRAEPGCAVSFNYLGQLEAGLDPLDHGEGFRWAGEGVGNAHSPRQRRRHLLEINAWVARGRLEVSWTYSPERHDEATVRRLAARFLAKLREIVDHCLSPGAGGYTPSDFPLASLDQATLDRLAGGSREIEDVYPLSPMQEGMLFHSLLAPRSSTYFEQFGYRLHADLDERAFRRAWQSLIDRHAILRTSFAWDTPGRPVQIVHRRAELVYRSEDWRGEADVPGRLARFLREDRERGFDLSRPPLLRVSVLRTGDRTHRFVWSIHHLLGEGWSNSLLLRDVLETYRALLQGTEPELEPVRPYRDYIAWLQRQSLAEAEAFWRHTLAGFEEPTALSVDRAPGRPTGEADPGTESLRLDAGETASLLAWTRSRQLTLNTLVQGAWALLLSVYSGREDVVFGCTVAGRPAALPGVESMVGLFINTLPLRVRIDAAEPAASWLRRLQAEQAELRRHEHSPLVQVQAWSEVPRGTSLFETLLVFENVPVDATLQQYASALETRSESVFERTNYPLELMAVPGAELSLTLRHDTERFDTCAVRRMLGHLRNALLGLATEGLLGRVPMLDESERRQVVTGWNRTER
ncbi:MAG TPA: amino acid adenylation domain-containing protein, partial [Thermoanaerobaculia bacterium]|nr:amino acid adenylation domain-containing protein [Thermoanaerobaculia bacterium]